ncbi:GlxA family transcriptional regulator [Maritalea mediterranea]|uniref:GlxA family transcriptional regulator n=1 Tax=Maritalea mediterranea TaxID=2909667 RepID=A0ABS9E8C3_9HYPH|nr:GlxA family transcriptional regulator [Maritalea mediterranea]MCF4098452.1 GlxA family transcriptional regulator [Maritalea mediterranea]
MFSKDAQKAPKIIGFLLVPEFSMMAFTSSIEPLRAANRLSGKTLYQWKILSQDGDNVYASNGVGVAADAALAEKPALDTLVVCAGLKAGTYSTPHLLSLLRDYARTGATMGSVCTGSHLLAHAGLLDGHRCTIHWEDVEGFAENFPHLDITATLFEIDRNRYTCSGGTAPLDMMIYGIAQDHGRDLAVNVAEQLLHNFVRVPHDTQRMPIKHRTGLNQPKLLAAIAHMEANIETPVSIHDIAASTQVSARQLERLFRVHLSKTPTRYYLEVRLHRAKLLLAQTTMPIIQVAVATGFTSASHFAKAYKELFGQSPSAEREASLSMLPSYANSNTA